VQQEYGAWLGTLEWDWFLTITFREPVPGHRQESVTHAVGNYLKKRWEPTLLFLCAEPHLSTTMHLHGLYKSSREDFVKPNEKLDVWSHLFDRFGRSQVAEPRGQGAVTKYVAKYCVKTQGYWEIW